MDLEMVLNELSLKTPAADEQTARQLMSFLTFVSAEESFLIKTSLVLV